MKKPTENELKIVSTLSSTLGVLESILFCRDKNLPLPEEHLKKSCLKIRETIKQISGIELPDAPGVIAEEMLGEMMNAKSQEEIDALLEKSVQKAIGEIYINRIKKSMENN